MDDYTDDSAVAAEIIERIAPECRKNVSLVREHVRFDALMERLPGYDLVIATRMHMAILALSSGTPALPIVAEFKTSELYRNLGLADWDRRDRVGHWRTVGCDGRSDVGAPPGDSTCIDGACPGVSGIVQSGWG